MLISLQLITLLILLGLSGFFSGSETALFSLSPIQKEKLFRRDQKRGRLLQDILDRPRTLIITVLIGNEFVNIAFSSLVAGLIIKLTNATVPWLNLLIVLPLLLLFGEITPKVIAISRSESFAIQVVRPLYYFMRLITPLRWLIRNLSDAILKLFIKGEGKREVIINEDVIRTIVSEGEKEGVLESIEREFIYRIFDFGDLRAEDVMTPRALLFSLELHTPVQTVIRKIKENHFSKVPIYADEPDNIVGILFATDLLSYNPTDLVSLKDISGLLRKPYFIPPNKRIDELFKIFQHQKISSAIVIDEYGIVQGIITIEDLLEQIFGEIRDEFESKDKTYEIIAENQFRFQAVTPLTEFNEIVGSNLTSEDVDTIGGYIFAMFGELPNPNAQIVVDNLQFTIEKIRHNRIETIAVKRL
jgi:putative hemolysin